MAYNFAQAANRLAIAEQQYAGGADIRFTRFTSCIGLVARNNNNLTAVHLVMFSSDDSQFDNNAAQAAVNLLGAYQEVVVVGQTGMWNAQIPAYQHLIGLLHNPHIVDRNDGVYGADIHNGTIRIN